MIEITPNLYDLKNIAENSLKDSSQPIVIPIYTEVISDIESPITLFYKICKQEPYSFLLESAESGESFGRYSILGFNPREILYSNKEGVFLKSFKDNKTTKVGEDPFDCLKSRINEYSPTSDYLPQFWGGAVGYFSYDSVVHIEPTLKDVFEQVDPCNTFPESFFIFPDLMIVFDHLKHKIFIINNIFVDKDSDLSNIFQDAEEKIKNVVSKVQKPLDAPVLILTPKTAPSTVKSNISKDYWNEIIDKSIEYIKAGEIFQVVLSQRFELENPHDDSFMIYRTLRSINPSPYMYYLNLNDFQIIGTSPEMLVKCTAKGKVNTCPIAGTRPRGKNLEHDDLLAKDMMNDPKELAEHLMLVDLGRNDLGRVCEYGSVKMEKFMDIERYSHVMHIVSHVTGIKRNDLSSIDVLKACFPAGTLSGAPKVRAMEIIYELEKSARGPYGGCIGYFGYDNELNTAITIRTILLKENKIFVQSGAGIVADSIAENEYQETKNKAQALLNTINLL